MHAELICKRLLLSAVVLVGVVDAIAVAGSASADSQPPIITIGPASNPNDSGTTSGTVGSAGQTTVCSNDQHSGVDPSAADPTPAVTVNDSSCTTGGTVSNGGGAQTHGGPPGSTSATGSASVARRHTGVSSAAAQRTVTAAAARGIRIVKLRFVSDKVRTRKALRLIVTLRDNADRLVQDAIVVARPLPSAKHTIGGPLAGFSDPVGQAHLTIPVTSALFGKKLQFVVSARTPHASTRRIAVVRVPAKATPTPAVAKA